MKVPSPPVLSPSAASTGWVYCVIVLFVLAMLSMAVQFAEYLRYALAAITYPFGLDYGEGIVWQQADLISGPRSYGNIDHFPFLVFHYPPVYHLLVHFVSGLGVDTPVAGRAISVLATIGLAGSVSLIVFRISNCNGSRLSGILGASFGGLSIFCYNPVLSWSVLMRVDMLALVISFMGVYLAITHQPGSRKLDLAGLLFVLALFTKQTSIAAPAAVLAVWWLADRRGTLRAIAIASFAALLGFGVLMWQSDGGFLRHIVLYNVNRFNIRGIYWHLQTQWQQGGFLIMAIAGLFLTWRPLFLQGLPNILKTLGQMLTTGQFARGRAILTVYLIMSTAMLVTLGKSGSSKNYLIEWMGILSVWSGVFIARLVADGVAIVVGPVREPRTVIGPRAMAGWALLVLAQALVLSQPGLGVRTDVESLRQLGLLVDRIRDAQSPVLSADMFLIRRADKEVPWEPSIFAELASVGRWDETLLTDMISARQFAFIITIGQRGQPYYDSHFNPAVDRAIEAAYSRVETVGNLLIRSPPR